MVFIIDRFYGDFCQNSCQVIKSRTLTTDEMIEVVGSIVLKNREIKQTKERCGLEKIGKILKECYECKDVKHKYIHELPFFKTRLCSKTLHLGFELCGEHVVWIDADEAMYLCMCRNITALQEKYINEKEELIRKILMETEGK